MFDLLSTHTVPLFRRSLEEGYLNNNHEWVQADFQDPVDLHCNIQPLNSAKQKIILPDGVRTDDMLVLRTRTSLNIADHYGTEEGDEISYKNVRYEIFKEEDWNGYGLATDHYKYIMKRKDQV
ncbi:MAG: hypothetical protein GOVbin2917_67 [Prokaryotic dsDNA virus sp.]|jgi:hypothetical protein|nr:MAG: hypothetical protein GOVbin2917_67 [Prokaryotic dsDNA virus sp.]|tara:strand:+ start:58421 stop:58789 length:369 start_codon:yes stop_codon:yes gene_type:complete